MLRNWCNDDDDRKFLDSRLVSVLADPLGPALIQAMHGGDPSQMEHLKRDMRQFRDVTALDGILEKAVIEWVSNDEDLSKLSKHHLRAKISKLIDEVHEETGFRSATEVPVSYCDGAYTGAHPATEVRTENIDIILSQSETSRPNRTTPVAVIQVGCEESMWWWNRFEKNVKHIDYMDKRRQEDPRLEFEVPLLCVVLTIEGARPPQQLKIKFGVFMCVPTSSGRCRIMLLRNTGTSNLKEASEAFGRFLRVASSFAGWRNEDDPTYQYLGPNSCRVGDNVSTKLIFTCICCYCYFSIIL